MYEYLMLRDSIVESETGATHHIRIWSSKAKTGPQRFVLTHSSSNGIYYEEFYPSLRWALMRKLQLLKSNLVNIERYLREQNK